MFFTAGHVSILHDDPRISVAGPRRASAQCLRLTAPYTEHLVGGRTVAVLGTPLDVATPVSNRALQAEITAAHHHQGSNERIDPHLAMSRSSARVGGAKHDPHPDA